MRQVDAQSGFSQDLSHSSCKEFLKQLAPDDLILTVNRRLSAYIQKNYENSQIFSGKSAWQNLSILPLSTFIEQLWEALTPEPLLLLTEFQEYLLWQEIIVDSPISADLLNHNNTASLARDTYKLLNHWLLDLEDIAYYSSLDVQTFVIWAKKFQDICNKRGYISRSEILQKVNQFLSLPSLSSKLPEKIYFVGFDDFSPAVQLLQQILKEKSNVKNIQLSQENNCTVQRISFHHSQIELQEMARWAYENISRDSNVKIGCIIPDLATKRDEIARIFKEVFYAEGLQKKIGQPPFNISVAKNLKQFSIIEAVFKILSLNNSEIDFEDISFLLRTPFIAGGENELHARAILDLNLRSFGEKKILLRLLIKNKFLKNSCSLLFNSLQKFLKLKKDCQHKMSIESWTSVFVDQLVIMGWPGERSLNSNEYQLVERFKKLLSDFSNLNKFFKEISFTQAFTLLQQLTHNTLFQPKTPDMPIQILGILEASGIEFDFLWVAGLDNETWPANASPNPFIPIELQKKYNMPHATSERELHFSINVTQRLIQNAKNIIFSHAQFDGDRPLSCSPLIQKYPMITRDYESFLSIEKLIFQTKNLEYYFDDIGPPIQNEMTNGGSWLFKAQAACPFQAFAKFRLQAQSLNDTQLGLAAYERGSLVHEILAILWKKINTHEILCSFLDHELNEIIGDAINEALLTLQEIKPITLKQNLFHLEKNRLQKLIFNWLQLEKLRQPFKVISTEEKRSASIGQLKINIQIDRVDQLSNGSHIIIDYKTGHPSMYDWFSDRPNEPQLPLYSILSEVLVAGILFAQIRSDQMHFKGLTIFHDIVPGAITLEQLKGYEFENMISVISYWQSVIFKLADDFCQGKAEVAPKDSATCLYCDLQELCRVNSIKQRN